MIDPKKRIDEDMIHFFVWSIWNFFTTTSRVSPEVEAPYLFTKFNQNDYTGVIGTSGNQHGAVYISMSRELLIDLYQNHYASSLGASFLGLSDHEFEALLSDAAGEMANTISGNVRNFLGENFLISTPAVFRSENEPLELPKETIGIVFPIKWKYHKCHLVAALRTKR